MLWRRVFLSQANSISRGDIPCRVLYTTSYNYYYLKMDHAPQSPHTIETAKKYLGHAMIPTWRYGCGSEPFQYVMRIMQGHKNVAKKMEHPIEAVSYPLNRGGRYRGLRLHYANGEFDDLSIPGCFKTRFSKNLVHAAMRDSISDQTRNFKANARDNEMWVCEICHTCIRDRHSAHVDHKIPFAKISSDFIEHYETPEVFERNERCLFKNSELESKWRIYHQTHGVLRILCASCNLRRAKK